MPLQKLAFRPGLNTQLSQTANEGGWYDAQFVRFRDGLPQKWNGWTTYSAQNFQGIPRSLWAWQDLSGNLDLAAGSALKLDIFQNGLVYDLTPVRLTTTPTNPFITTAGSATVTVTDTGNGVSVGDFVEVVGGTAVGGLTLYGEYTVASVINANSYTITAASVASANATGGGTPTIVYLISPGLVDASVGFGVGGGLVGTGTVGTSRSLISTTLLPRQWSLANWGEFLMAVPRGGALYQWQPAWGFSGRAAVVTNATPANGPPLLNNGMFVAMPERHLVLFGCSDLNATTNQDPMLVRFSNVEDYTTWPATVTNSAGSFRLQGGTRLVGGLNITGQNLLWSDSCLFSMTFIGLPYVYSFNRLGTGCGLVGPKAMGTYGGAVYWMGPAAFYAFNGGAPQEIPCSEWNTIFRNLNTLQLDKVTCAVNSSRNEVTWHYPSASSLENDSYATYNYVENLWYTGNIQRTAWVDLGVFQLPLATDATGALYSHETGTDAAGAAMDAWIVSGFLDIGDGTEFMFIDKIIPDFVYQTGNVYMTVYVTDYPNNTPTAFGPFTLTPSTQYISMRARGRQVAVKFESSDLGADWRLGAVRVQVAPDGRR